MSGIMILGALAVCMSSDILSLYLLIGGLAGGIFLLLHTKPDEPYEEEIKK